MRRTFALSGLVAWGLLCQPAVRAVAQAVSAAPDEVSDALRTTELTTWLGEGLGAYAKRLSIALEFQPVVTDALPLRGGPISYASTSTQQSTTGVLGRVAPGTSTTWEQGCRDVRERREQLRLENDTMSMPSMVGPWATISAGGSTAIGALIAAARADSSESERSGRALIASLVTAAATTFIGLIWYSRQEREHRQALKRHEELQSQLLMAEKLESQCSEHERAQRKRGALGSLLDQAQGASLRISSP